MSKKKKFAFAAALTGATAATLTAGMYLRQEFLKRRPFILNEATLTELQDAMKIGRITAKQLTAEYLKRIARQKQLHAIVELNPNALHEAEASDVRRSVNAQVGPLFGIPVLVNANIETAEVMHTTAGSRALADYRAEKDAFIIKKMKDAGAIIIGKTNIHELSGFVSESMPDGYSAIGGQTINPYGASFDVGGSSSGTAAAVAANLVAIGVGTETSGLKLNPATANSIVSIRPTIGLIGRSGIIPIAHSQDTVGPLARTVQDAVILLNILTGLDESDEETIWSQGEVKKDYTVYLRKNGLKNARIGIDRSFSESENNADREPILAAIRLMQKQGAQIIDPVALPSADSLMERHSTVLLQEFKWEINRYLGQLHANLPVHSLSEWVAFNRTHAQESIKFGQSLLERAEKLSGDLGDRDYLIDRADDIRFSRKEGIDAVMKAHHLDALIFTENWGGVIAAKAGYPSVTVPVGYGRDGKPSGITFTGQAFSEPRLIELAYALEQAGGCRRPPAI